MVKKNCDIYNVCTQYMLINKRPSGVDGHLCPISLRLTCQRFSRLQFKQASFWSTNHNQRLLCYHAFMAWFLKKIFIHKRVGVQKSEESQFIYPLAQGANILVIGYLQIFNGQSFIIFIFIYNAHKSKKMILKDWIQFYYGQLQKVTQVT